MGFVIVFVGERKVGKEKRVGKVRNGGFILFNMEFISVGFSNIIILEEFLFLMFYLRI